MNSQYTKKVTERFLNPKNMGELEDADGIGEVGNTKCGDVMKVYIKISDDKISDIKFQTLGCVAAIASTDIVCSLAKGRTLEDAGKITKKEILDELGGLPAVKVHCSMLGEEAIKNAIENYKKKNIGEKKDEK